MTLAGTESIAKDNMDPRYGVNLPDSISVDSGVDHFDNPRRYKLHALPSTWSSWYKIGSHSGRVTYTVTLEPEGNTNVKGKIKYYDESGAQVVRVFYDRATFTTGNSVAYIELSLKGLPLGTPVFVTVSP